VDDEWFFLALSGATCGVALYALSRAQRSDNQTAATRADPKPRRETAPAPAPDPQTSPSAPPLPRIHIDEDEDVDPTRIGADAADQVVPPPTREIVCDDDASFDEPTHAGALILVTASAQTDKGLRRKRNEDSILKRDDLGLYVVADGMGGHAGGEVASALVVETLERAFRTEEFEAVAPPNLPPRASMLVRGIHMANRAVVKEAAKDPKLKGMGTTICAAYFSPHKQRVYVGHVGDSRLYRLRDGALKQMTSDHTMAELGVSGPGSEHLSRALGVWPRVTIDLLVGKPRPTDIYLLCSDGLTKMVSDETIASILATRAATVDALVERLVEAANAGGGKDNVSVIAIRVDDPLSPRRPAS
jgi:protein phosphatase